MIELINVESSSIAAMGHDPATSVMRVRFNSDKDAVYDYQNVSKEIFESIRTAASIGSTFHSVIKKHPSQYPYSRVL